MSIIDDLEFSVRAGNVLRKMNPEMTLDDFMALTKKEVIAQKNAGARTWREVAEMQAHFRQVARERRKAKSGGPAYPIPGGYAHEMWPGMSLRDAAALATLQGIVSGHDETGMWCWTPETAAKMAWEVADAFIAARETKEDDR